MSLGKPGHRPVVTRCAERTESVSISELVEQITGFVRRQLPIFLFITACSIGLGLTYLFATPARYTAHAMLLIDSSKVRMLQQQQRRKAHDLRLRRE